MEELCLLQGFKKEQVLDFVQALTKAQEKTQGLGFAPMTDTMLDEIVKDVCTKLFEGEKVTGTAITEGDQVVFLAVQSQARAVSIMRAIKSCSSKPQDIIFAMITQTALDWTFTKYIEHVTQEHEYMKTNNPANDPDMKKI